MSKFLTEVGARILMVAREDDGMSTAEYSSVEIYTANSLGPSK